jgi:hypothetical protein
MGRVELVPAGDPGDPAIYRVAPRPAGRGVAGPRVMKVRGGGLTGLRFRHPDGREFVKSVAWLDGAPLRFVRDEAGGKVAMVKPTAIPHRRGGYRTGYAVTLDEWFVLAERGPATIPITPPASVAEGTGPAASGETLRDEEVAVFEANNFTSKVESGPIERGAWKVMGWVWPAILAAAVVAVLAWAAGARGDEPRQWTRPYLVVPTCPGGRCSQPRPMAATYRPLASAAGPAPAYRAPAAQAPRIVYYRTRCRFGRCGR